MPLSILFQLDLIELEDVISHFLVASPLMSFFVWTLKGSAFIPSDLSIQATLSLMCGINWQIKVQHGEPSLWATHRHTHTHGGRYEPGWTNMLVQYVSWDRGYHCRVSRALWGVKIVMSNILQRHPNTHSFSFCAFVCATKDINESDSVKANQTCHVMFWHILTHLSSLIEPLLWNHAC